MRRMRGRVSARAGVFGAALVFAFAPPGSAAAQEYHVDLEADNVVRFISAAPLHEFDGVTHRIDGFVILREGGLEVGAGEGAEFYLEVDLGSLDTGIGLRNRQMRDSYLETHLFPYATFGGSIVDVSAPAPSGVSASGRGDMEIHGVSRPMQITCDVTPRGERFRARCAFGLELSDFDIQIPNVMFLKLANDIRVEIDFWVKPARSEKEAA